MLSHTAADVVAFLAVGFVLVAASNLYTAYVVHRHAKLDAALWQMQNKMNQAQCAANRHIGAAQSAAAEALKYLAASKDQPRIVNIK